MSTMYPVGSLVRTRGREYIVTRQLGDDGVLWLQPVGGDDKEEVGVLPDLDPVTSSTFAPPGLDDIGDFVSARLLRDAVRLGFRNSAGPFRSFGKIGVEPRSYQLVPLMMALKLDPIRLLIGDDVGIGKTIEALVVAVEALTSGQATGLAVLCPPHLAEQWADEMRTKFHLDPTLVLSSTAPRLERNLAFGESLFERHPVTVVSTDFIKSARRRDEFVRAAPDLVIVDEAHTVAADLATRSVAAHQRRDLVVRLAQDQRRHLLLVTATPHTGNEAAFQSLLRLLNPSLDTLDPTREYADGERATIAQHFIQRKRADIRTFLQETTVFPDRYELQEDGEYRVDDAYQQFIDEVRSWARGTLSAGAGGPANQQRLRYWSVLGLLRQVASSPRAAAATLRTRAANSSDDAVADIDAEQRSRLLDSDEVDPTGDADQTVGVVSDLTDADVLERLATTADGLATAEADTKLRHVTGLVRRLLDDGFNPIVFCRYIHTAEYVAEHLDAAFRDVRVEAVTGRLPSDQRERAVATMGPDDRRVLVATDCLSEGINLQELFSAVVHYDLPWNPTRLEQREGRVDRYGQPSPEVRIATLHSDDTLIDPLVMNVLLRKHRTIRNNLGVTIPVPGSAQDLIEEAASVLMDAASPTLGLGEDPLTVDGVRQRFSEWDNVSEREKRSRTKFAQESVKVDEVAAQVASVRDAIGRAVDVQGFVRTAVERLGGTATAGGMADQDPARISTAGLPSTVRHALGAALGRDLPDHLYVRFELPVQPDELLLIRTHPVVAALAAHLVDAAIDEHTDSAAARAAVIATNTVSTPTVLHLLRHRYDLRLNVNAADRTPTSLLVEDLSVVGYQPAADDTGHRWLDPVDAERLLDELEPTDNVDHDEKHKWFTLLTDPDRFAAIPARIDEHLLDRANDTLAEHRAVRAQAGGGMGQAHITPKPPADIIATYVLRTV